jgi:hypothetical protein
MFSKIIVAAFALIACAQAFMAPAAMRSTTSMSAERTDRYIQRLMIQQQLLASIFAPLYSATVKLLSFETAF